MTTTWQPLTLPGCEDMVKQPEPAAMRVHPIAALFPMMADDDLADLAADIKANGLVHPIVRDAEGQLIDGRNRLKACELAGVEPCFETLDGRDPVAFILSANVERRHLTKGQRAMAVAVARQLLVSNKPRLTQIALSHAVSVSQSRIAQAETVFRYATELVDSVMAGGSLDDAYAIAQERKRREDEDDKALTRLRREHPNLAAQVEAGGLTVGAALAAAEAITRRQMAEQETARLMDAIALAREEVGETVSLPPMRELAPAFAPDAQGQMVTPEFARGEDTKQAALQAEHDFLRRLVEVKRQVQAIAGAPVLTEVSWREGHLNAVRSAAAAMVMAVYQMVDAHEAQLGARPTLREVK